MIPYNNTDLPIEIKYDLEMMRLLLEAKDLYATYNAMLLYQGIDPHLVLKPFILQESFKSCEMAGNKVTQEELYFLRYRDSNDDSKEIQNYCEVLTNIETYLTRGFHLSLLYLNKIHKNINNSKRGSYFTPGQLRKKDIWLGRRGVGIQQAEFIPTTYSEIPRAITNFIRYFNKRHSVDSLVEIAISHSQFESIHPYIDANGRLGRILIPIQAFLDGKSHVSLFLSEVLKENEYMYYQRLQDTRNNRWERYIKFFLEMMIEQLNRNIEKVKTIREIYKADSRRVEELVKPKYALDVYHYMFSNIVFTIKEMSEELGIEYQTTRNYLNRLFDRGLLSKHKVSKGEYVYTYIKMYGVHVPVHPV